MDHTEAGRYWNENAEVWTRLARAGYDVYRDHLNTPAFLGMLPDMKGLSGIDIGCDEGHNTRLIARRCARLVGIDIAEVFVRHAAEAERKEPLGIEFRVASAADIPFPDRSFDFATSVMCLMDVPETGRAMKPCGDARTCRTRRLSPTSFTSGHGKPGDQGPGPVLGRAADRRRA